MAVGNILIIDDNKSILSALEILLQTEYESVSSISNPNQISSFPNLEKIDLVLLDMNFSTGINTGNEGLFWLRKLKELSPGITVIMMTAYGNIELAVNALKEDAYDFILKPWNNEKLMAIVKSAIAVRYPRVEKLKLTNNDSSIIGNSKALNQVLTLTDKIANTDVNVLITGENGTGKEMIAKALHVKSNRRNEVFISVDMGSISENLFESELFGHLKGSFTDANEDRIGKFEAAEGGTLFLDEIGNLSLSMQSKLLSAIQNKTIVKIGSNKPTLVDIRLICATNCNLEQMVEAGEFREDLLYRINTIQVKVPPLRERNQDIILLSSFFLKKFSLKYGKPEFSLSKHSKIKLLEYQWPGNVRELQHVIERAVILNDTTVIEPEDLAISTIKKPSLSTTLPTLEQMEEEMISKTLLETAGNYTEAANRLGITRQTLYNKLKKMKFNGK